MHLNYLMIPENIMRRPLPGHRHRPKKVKKVSEAFTPVSRAGRRVPGEAKVKTAMANNAKKAEERSAADLFKFIKKLNKISAARSTLPGGEQTEVEAAPKLVATNEKGASESLPDQLTQKPPVADSAKSYTCEVIDVRVVRRARSNAISTSSRVKLEEVIRPPNIVNATEDTVNLVGNAVSAGLYDSACQSFTGRHFHHHEPVATTNIVQQHPPFLEHAVRDTVLPAFPDHPATHQPANQHNFILPEHNVPNWPVEPFWLNPGPAPGFPLHDAFETRNDEYFELERVAIGCAYAGMGEPMEIDSEFPTFIPDDTYADLNLERVAIACAYAGMDEAMDTAIDDTRGPILDFVPQALQMFDQADFAQYVPPQQALLELDVGVQPPMYQTVQQLEHQYFVDQDQRLLPPIHAYPIDQPFQPERFVVNEMVPPHMPVQANDYPVIEEYFPAFPPFDIGHAVHVQADVPLPLLPIIHDQPVGHQFELYHRIHEEFIEPQVLPIVNETVGYNVPARYQEVDEEEQLNYFLNDEVGEPDNARLFEDLFGAEDDDDDDDDDEGVEVILW